MGSTDQVLASLVFWSILLTCWWGVLVKNGDVEEAMALMEATMTTTVVVDYDK